MRAKRLTSKALPRPNTPPRAAVGRNSTKPLMANIMVSGSCAIPPYMATAAGESRAPTSVPLNRAAW